MNPAANSHLHSRRLARWSATRRVLAASSPTDRSADGVQPAVCRLGRTRDRNYKTVTACPHQLNGSFSLPSRLARNVPAPIRRPGSPWGSYTILDIQNGLTLVQRLDMFPTEAEAREWFERIRPVPV